MQVRAGAIAARISHITASALAEIPFGHLAVAQPLATLRSLAPPSLGGPRAPQLGSAALPATQAGSEYQTSGPTTFWEDTPNPSIPSSTTFPALR